MENYSNKQIILAEVLADIHAKTLNPFFNGLHDVYEYENSEYFHTLELKTEDENSVDKVFFLEMAKFFESEIDKGITIENLARLISDAALYCLKGFYDANEDISMYDQTPEKDDHPKHMSREKYRDVSEYMLEKIQVKAV